MTLRTVTYRREQFSPVPHVDDRFYCPGCNLSSEDQEFPTPTNCICVKYGSGSGSLTGAGVDAYLKETIMTEKTGKVEPGTFWRLWVYDDSMQETLLVERVDTEEGIASGVTRDGSPFVAGIPRLLDSGEQIDPPKFFGRQVKQVAEEAANNLAAGVRSFLESLPFCAPENIGAQAQAKLVEPLAEYDEEVKA